VELSALLDFPLPPYARHAGRRYGEKHLWGILVKAIIENVTHAMSESENSRIQKFESMACGFRNRTRFKWAILFHFGGLSFF